MIFEATKRDGAVVRVPRWLWSAIGLSFAYIASLITALAIAAGSWAWENHALDAAQEQRITANQQWQADHEKRPHAAAQAAQQAKNSQPRTAGGAERK